MDPRTSVIPVGAAHNESIQGHEPLEQIFCSRGKLIAYILQFNFSPSETVFITPNHLNQQAGFIVYPKNSVLKRHYHQPLQRHIIGTQEILLVRSGQLEVELYSDLQESVAKRTLIEGDILILVSGGHGFKMLEDTVLFEIKQGPYMGPEEKENF